MQKAWKVCSLQSCFLILYGVKDSSLGFIGTKIQFRVLNVELPRIDSILSNITAQPPSFTAETLLLSLETALSTEKQKGCLFSGCPQYAELSEETE